MLPLFEGRILAFDVKAAATFAHINAKAQAAGSTLSFADGAIAAIALANGFAVATRNVGDFANTGVKIIWSAAVAAILTRFWAAMGITPPLP